MAYIRHDTAVPGDVTVAHNEMLPATSAGVGFPTAPAGDRILRRTAVQDAEVRSGNYFEGTGVLSSARRPSRAETQARVSALDSMRADIDSHSNSSS